MPSYRPCALLGAVVLLATCTVGLSAGSACGAASGCSTAPPVPPGNTTAKGGVPADVGSAVRDFLEVTAALPTNITVNATTKFLLSVYDSARQLAASYPATAAQFPSVEAAATSALVTFLSFASNTAPAAYKAYNAASTPADKAAVLKKYNDALAPVNASVTDTISALDKLRLVTLAVSGGTADAPGFGYIVRGINGEVQTCTSLLPAQLKNANASLVSAETRRSDCAPSNTTCTKEWDAAIAKAKAAVAAAEDGLAWCAAQNDIASRLHSVMAELGNYWGSNLNSQATFAAADTRNALADLTHSTLSSGVSFILFTKTAVADATDPADSLYAFTVSACRNLCG